MKKADWNLWIRSKYTGRKRKDGIDMEETIFRQELQKRTTAIEDLLKQYLPAEEGYQKTVIEAMNYSLMAGGKRLRDRKSTRLNSSHIPLSRMPSSA